MTSQQLMVYEFATLFDAHRAEQPTFPELHIAKLRMNLIYEELGELKGAFERQDILGIADGCGDLLYVLLGAAIACGITVLPFTFATPGLVPLPIDSPTIRQQLQRLSDDTFRLEEAMTFGTIRSIEYFLHHLCIKTYALATYCGLDLIGIFQEIHRSNMTKVWTEEPHDLPEDCTATAIVGGWRVNRSDGKIIRPSTYSKPDLTRFIESLVTI